MKLHAHVPRVHGLGQLDDLGQLLTLCQGRDDQASVTQLVEVVDVGLVAVAVALAHNIAINAMRNGALDHIRALRTEAHGAAQVRVGRPFLNRTVGVFPLVNQRNHRRFGLGIELGGVGV